MPNKYKPLTDEEKEAARQKFEFYIGKLNAYFAKKGWPQYNYEEEKTKFEEKLNNEEMVARYRLANEISEKEKALKEAGRKVYELEKAPKNDFLARSFNYFFKTDGSKESEEYNKNLYKSYKENSVEFTYNRVKNLLNYDPTELINIGNDPVKALEFYRDNLGLCHEANEFGDFFDTKGFYASKELLAAKETIKGFAQEINFVSNYLGQSKDIDFFAIPSIPKDKVPDIRFNEHEIYGRGVKLPSTYQSMLGRMGGNYDNKYSMKEFCEKLEEKGLKVDKNLFTKYKITKIDPETNEEKQTSVYDLISGKPNIKVTERSKEEISKINEIGIAFRGRYNIQFQNRMATRIGNAYNIENIENNMKGGFWARIFRRPSNEFKEYMEALKDYTNPDKPGFLDKETLTNKAQAYLNHIHKDGKTIENMNSTRQRRANLVINTMNVISDMKKDDLKIRGEINKEINDSIPHEFGVAMGAAIDKEDVEEFELIEKNNSLEFELDNSVDDLNKSV